MKVKIFVLFLCIPSFIYSQVTKTLDLDGTRFGAVYSPLAGYGFQENSSQIHVGKTATNQATIGRGYLTFDLSALTVDIINHMTKAELVFSCGSSLNDNDNNHAIVIKKLVIPGYGDDLHAQPSNAYAELNSTYNDTPDTVYLKRNAIDIKKTIIPNLISISYNPNPNLS